MGNVHFLHAVMRHGIFQLRDQRELASALLQARNSVDEHHADDVEESLRLVPNSDTLRAEAVHARQQVKKAKKLLAASNSGATLTPSEEALCID